MKNNPKVMKLRAALASAWTLAYHLELEGGKGSKFFKDMNSKINIMELSLTKMINHPDNETDEREEESESKSASTF